MTKKEFLRQAFLIDRVIKCKERQIEALQNHAEYLTPQFSGMPSGSLACKSKLEEAAVKIVDLQEELSTEILALAEKRRTISAVIKAINNPEYETILIFRYLEYLEWTEIASRMGYSLQAIYKAHGRALELIKVP